jgi:iron complex transport system permease protein
MKNKSLFASFSSEKDESSFFEKKEAKKLLLFGAVAGLVIVSLIAGKVWVPLTADAGDPRWAIIVTLRLPRTLLALAVGAGLGMSGAAMQAYTRNALADPGVLGVSAMAALGAVLTLYFSPGGGTWPAELAAVLGAGIGVLATLALAGFTGSTVTFLLAGVILNTVASAGLALALSLAPDPWAAQEIIDWLMGSLTDRGMPELELALPLIALGGVLLLSLGRGLDALTLGETGARALGIHFGWLRLCLTAGIGLAVGGGVAVTGVIGFVGLIVPHLLRPWFGNRPSALLLPSALGGAILVLAADCLVRVTRTGSETRLGVAMAVLGAPFFLALLLRMRRRLA